MMKIIGTIKESYSLSYLLFWCYRVFNFRDKLKNGHSRFSIEDVDELSALRPYFPEFVIKDNNLYGLGRVLSDFIREGGRFSKIFNTTIAEHGLVFGDFVQDQILRSFASKIITFGQFRKEVIARKTTKTAIPIGPYIAYANSLLADEEMKEIKEKWGKTLLVFPTHSISTVRARFNVDEFCEEVNRISKGFDTVAVCLYWKDVLLGAKAEYLKRGYRVVTAGNIYDSDFLPRLKSIIMLSDAAMSNSVGTQIGYCLYLNKPFYIFSQQYRVESIEGKKSREMDQLAQISTEDSWEVIRRGFLCAFSELPLRISDDQYKLANYYWGFDCVRSPKELKEILN